MTHYASPYQRKFSPMMSAYRMVYVAIATLCPSAGLVRSVAESPDSVIDQTEQAIQRDLTSYLDVTKKQFRHPERFDITIVTHLASKSFSKYRVGENESEPGKPTLWTQSRVRYDRRLKISQAAVQRKMFIDDPAAVRTEWVKSDSRDQFPLSASPPYLSALYKLDIKSPWTSAVWRGPHAIDESEEPYDVIERMVAQGFDFRRDVGDTSVSFQWKGSGVRHNPDYYTLTTMTFDAESLTFKGIRRTTNYPDGYKRPMLIKRVLTDSKGRPSVIYGERVERDLTTPPDVVRSHIVVEDVVIKHGTVNWTSQNDFFVDLNGPDEIASFLNSQKL